MGRQSLFDMKAGEVYALLVAKAEKKGHTRAEVDEVTGWLLGYTPAEIEAALASGIDERDFFDNAPRLNPAARKLTGAICGVRIEEIEDDLLWKIRCLDKLVDDLTKGRPMDKILRRA